MSYSDNEMDYAYNEPRFDADDETRESDREKDLAFEDAWDHERQEPIFTPGSEGNDPACELESITSTVSGPKCIIMTLNLNMNEIQKHAYLLSTEYRSYDDFKWELAKIEARLKPAYITRLDDGLAEIIIDAAKIVDQPSNDEIYILERDIETKQPSIQELHWLIAERQYIYETAKSRIHGP